MSGKDCIRVRQVSPGVWVPDRKGTHEIPAAHAGLHAAGPENTEPVTCGAVYAGTDMTEPPGTHAGSCPLGETMAPEPVTTASILAVIGEPLGVPGDQLPAWGTPLTADGCSSCLLPVAVRDGLCLYCQALHQLQGAAPAANSRREEARAGNPGTRDGPHRERLPGHSRCGCSRCRADRAGSWLCAAAVVLIVVVTALSALMIEGLVTL